MDALSQETIAILGVGVVLAGFFWSLHRDVADLRERIARVEGMFEGLRDSFSRLERRFDGLERRFEGLERRFEGLERRFNDRFPPSPAAGV